MSVPASNDPDRASVRWQAYVDGPGIWLCRSQGDQARGGFPSYETMIIVTVGDDTKVDAHGQVVGGKRGPVRFMRLRDNTWTKLEHVPFAPETVYAFVEPLWDATERSGWRVRERLEATK